MAANTADGALLLVKKLGGVVLILLSSVSLSVSSIVRSDSQPE
jgi:hypothetical protein